MADNFLHKLNTKGISITWVRLWLILGAEPTFEILGGKFFLKKIYNKLRGNTKKIKNLELKF
jgi:hypothetical protein